MSGKKARRSRIEREKQQRELLDQLAQGQGFIDYADFEHMADAVHLARNTLTDQFANRREWREVVDRCVNVLHTIQLMTALIKEGKGKDFIDVYAYARDLQGTRRTVDAESPGAD